MEVDPMIGIAGVMVGAAIASFLLGFPVRNWLVRRKVFDHPTARSSHEVPTPRGGGVAILLVIVGGEMVTQAIDQNAAVILGAAIVLAGIGLIDDRHSVPWRIRLACQALMSAAAALSLLISIHSQRGWHEVALGLVITFVLVGYGNAFNFMDGVNGLAGTQAVLTGIGTILVGVGSGLSCYHPAVILNALIAGAAGGFLPHNFPCARIFMGDVGSVPLGFLLAASGAWIGLTTNGLAIFALAALHGNFVLDASITMFRRWRRGEAVQTAHREHFYQRLARAGQSHTRITVTESVIQLVVIGLLLTVVLSRGKVPVLPAGVCIVAVWLGFFAYAEARFQASQRKQTRTASFY